MCDGDHHLVQSRLGGAVGQDVVGGRRRGERPRIGDGRVLRLQEMRQAGHTHAVGAERVQLVGGDEVLVGDRRRVLVPAAPADIVDEGEMPPKAATVSRTTASISSARVTLQAIPRQSPPVSALIVAAVAAALSPSRSAIITFAPAPQRVRAMPAPMFWAPPVTMACARSCGSRRRRRMSSAWGHPVLWSRQRHGAIGSGRPAA